VLPLSVLSPTADVQKMTQTEERQSAVFTELYTARTANSRVTGLELNFCRHNRLILLLGIGVAEAANPTRGNRRLSPRQCSSLRRRG